MKPSSARASAVPAWNRCARCQSSTLCKCFSATSNCPSATCAQAQTGFGVHLRGLESVLGADKAADPTVAALLEHRRDVAVAVQPSVGHWLTTMAGLTAELGGET